MSRNMKIVEKHKLIGKRYVIDSLTFECECFKKQFSCDQFKVFVIYNFYGKLFFPKTFEIWYTKTNTKFVFLLIKIQSLLKPHYSLSFNISKYSQNHPNTIELLFHSLLLF